MPSRRCNLKCTLRLILPLHIRKVIGKGCILFLLSVTQRASVPSTFGCAT